MAGELNVGTLSGRIEMEDTMTPSIDLVNAKIDKLDEKFTGLGRQVQGVGRAHEEAGGHVQNFGDQFEHMAVRIAERLAIYTLIREGISFGKEAIDAAAGLQKMTLATDIEADALQRIIKVGNEFGIEGEQMTQVIATLSARVASGDHNAVGAIGALGLSIDKLKAAGPKELFLQLTEAAGRVADPLDKAGIMAELFGGRLGKQLIPILGELRQKMAEVPKEAIVSDANIKASATFENNLRVMKEGAQAFTVSFLGAMLGMDGFSDSVDSSIETSRKQIAELHAAEVETGSLDGALELLSKREQEHVQSQKETISSSDLLNNRLRDLKERALEPLTLTQQANILVLDKYKISVTDTAKALGVSQEAVQKFMDEQHKQAEEMKTFESSWTNLNSLGVTWKETLAGISPELQAQILYYAGMGASVKDLTDGFKNLTPAQAEAAREGVKAAGELEKVLLHTLDLQNKMHGDSIRDWITLEDRKFQATIADLQRTGQLTKEMLDAQVRDHKTAIASEIQARDEQDQYSRGFYQKEVDDAKAALDLMVLNYRDHTDAEIRIATQGLVEKERALGHWVQESNEKLFANSAATKSNADTMRDHEQVIDSYSAHWLMLAGQLDKTTVKVRTLSGEMITLAEAEARRSSGGSFDVTAENFKDSLSGVVTGMSGGLAGIHVDHAFAGMGNVGDVAYALAKAGYSFQEILMYMRMGVQSVRDSRVAAPSGPRIPGFKDGGWGDFGAGTMVELHGKEAIVPLPLEHGGPLGGGGVTIAAGAFQFNYPIMNDPTAIDHLEKVISQALIGKLRSYGVRANSST